MSNKDLREDPHDLKDVRSGTESENWWYESKRGVEVVAPCECGKAKILLITWRSLRSALKRKDMKPV